MHDALKYFLQKQYIGQHSTAFTFYLKFKFVYIAPKARFYSNSFKNRIGDINLGPELPPFSLKGPVPSGKIGQVSSVIVYTVLIKFPKNCLFNFVSF